MKLNGIEFDELDAMTCSKCGYMMDPIYNYVESNNSIQARCSECNSFIQNMKHKEVIEGEDAEPPTSRQMIFIKSFYSSKQMPKTKKRASELIHLFNKVRDDYEL